MNSEARARAFCLTINNPELEILDVFEKYMNKNNCINLIVESEFGSQEETFHLQCYIRFKNQTKFSAIKKKFPTAHIEQAKGTAKQNFKYCSKDDNILFLKGEFDNEQGKRNDLNEIKNLIIGGEMSVNDIAKKFPNAYHQYGRTLEKLEDIHHLNTKRNFMTKGTWYFGKTGVGKTHQAFEDAKLMGAENSCYIHNIIDGGWWDGYTGQKVVIINDFRGNIEYDELLRLVDKWPHTVKRRGKAPIPFTSELVIITSALRPEECYARRNEKDSIDQLLRRFEIIEIINNENEIE